MKIGTDGVLLGAWCSIDSFIDSILDVGTGTGVISLMLAQRCDALTIDAVEIDANSYEQSVENFENSDWGDRLYSYHSSYEEFATELAEEDEKYDLIISNPPFYTDDYETKDIARNKARFTSSLSFEKLIVNTTLILDENGIFSVILPFKEEGSFVKLAKKNNLFLNKICHVKGNPDSEIKRSLLEFSFQEKEIVKEQLIIEIKRHQYTEAYINLTKDFYLKM